MIFANEHARADVRLWILWGLERTILKPRVSCWNKDHDNYIMSAAQVRRLTNPCRPTGRPITGRLAGRPITHRTVVTIQNEFQVPEKASPGRADGRHLPGQRRPYLASLSKSGRALTCQWTVTTRAGVTAAS